MRLLGARAEATISRCPGHLMSWEDRYLSCHPCNSFWARWKSGGPRSTRKLLTEMRPEYGWLFPYLCSWKTSYPPAIKGSIAIPIVCLNISSSVAETMFPFILICSTTYEANLPSLMFLWCSQPLQFPESNHIMIGKAFYNPFVTTIVPTVPKPCSAFS